MTRPNGTGRPAPRPLSVLRDDRGPGSGTGTGIEPHRRGDVEPFPRGGVPAGEVDALRARLGERTADLRRLRSEFDGYRRRTHRDRRAVGEIAVANVLTGLLPVLDAIEQAHRYGEVTGGFRHVAGVLEAELAALGLRSYGAPGDPFDPAVHEAVTCVRSGGVERPTCTRILCSGYRVGDRLLRPARVEVTAPVPEGPRDGR
ncbi:molecular chaperone GrpE [Actinacidiphila yanglinensis]|uniref:Protein GrpE n=1 Tax=Actinacidiphila yanglinensis TaxID=310779 RepID=A0A1H6D7X1_9ACTN|nr:nucleotide exchange factor GrpE [Actinacidiphila yanglinensis]SEG81178.1 molecular chaperone GrpE [Actinacidiphila yanglinensis]